MAKKKKVDPKKYNLLKEIKGDKNYGLDPKDRTHNKRRIIERNLNTTRNSNAFIGQLCYFKYFTPMTKEDLDYYDARPVVLVFGNFNNKDGEPRILGFNIHFYPPKIRYLVMDKIFKIFKKYYTDAWDDGLKQDISGLKYGMLLKELQKAKLDFGVRMYAPYLIKEFIVVPTEYFKDAIMTEGVFKKKSRDLIMKYWEHHRT